APIPAVPGLKAMRSIVIGIALLASVGWLGCAFDSTQPEAPRVRASQWRRTVDGWERLSIRSNAISAAASPFGSSGASMGHHPHPTLFSLLVSMLSPFVLVANHCDYAIFGSKASVSRLAKIS